MTTDDLQVICTEGSALERAAQFGEATREALAAYLALTEPALRHFSSPRGQALRANLLDYFYALDPPLELEETYCRAAGCSAETLIERAAAFSAGKSKLDFECSGVVLKKDGLVVLGQNLDTGTECRDANLLEIAHDPDGQAYARFCWPSMLSCMHGVNIHGVANGGASGPPGDPMSEGKGLPVLLTRWLYFYRCLTPAEVAGAAARYPVVGKGTNNVWANAAGEVVRTEEGGGALAVSRPTQDWAVATGHRTHLHGEELGRHAPEKAAAELARWRRLNGLAEQASKTPGDPVEQMKLILADHETVDGHPASAPCRHGDESTGSTQFSFVYDLTGRVVHYCGTPCENEWRQIAL